MMIWDDCIINFYVAFLWFKACLKFMVLYLSYDYVFWDACKQNNHLMMIYVKCYVWICINAKRGSAGPAFC